MIVEDDAAVRDILTIALEREGMTVEAVEDGETALAQITSAGPSPDLVLLDIMLPGVDGVTVCQELRRVSDVPVIMLTAREGERNVVVGLEVGADDYVTKPVSPAEVVSRVRAQLRRRVTSSRTSWWTSRAGTSGPAESGWSSPRRSSRS
jgi:DNA-binding response OmpR family regulator